MADGVWKGVYPYVFGHSKQLLLNKFFNPSTPSMRKGRNGGEKTDGNSGHFVIARTPTARTPTAGTPHARAKNDGKSIHC